MILNRTLLLIAALGFALLGFALLFIAASDHNNRQALSTSLINIAVPTEPVDFTFMEVHVIDRGATANERFFIGDLPHAGDAVEMVYVGSRDDGAMRFQLRTKK